nr:uncharacterized protein K02A2.6-like [Onthophagus taurus]
MLPYYQYRYDIPCHDKLLTKGTRIIIPKVLQKECLDYIHTGHFGTTKCRESAKMSVWWFGISIQIENVVRNCPRCVEERRNPEETSLKEPIPDKPWQRVAADLFKLKKWYLIIIDYYSRFFEIFELTHMREDTIIGKFKQTFSRYGIPEVVRTDNGPQFQTTFKNFAMTYKFKHITSNPYFPQSNGCAERAAAIAKQLLTKNQDIYMALLAYKSTPLESGFTPSELLMSRGLRTNLPMIEKKLNETVNVANF